jgi:hypothetical protein
MDHASQMLGGAVALIVERPEVLSEPLRLTTGRADDTVAVAPGCDRDGDVMGIADRIYDLVKALPEAEACKILRFAEELRSQQVSIVPAKRQVDLAMFRQFRGRYDGVKIDRDSLYDRGGVR